MNVLVVFAHPAADSFQASLCAAAVDRLSRDHAVTVVDLYREAFDPVLDEAAWRAHRQDLRQDESALSAHFAALREAEALVLVFPTWWYGLPAILKGWFDRVWRPGVAFAMQDGVFQTHYLPKLRRFAVLTTYGSPRRFIEWGIGDPLRRQLMRGLALQFARDLRKTWLPIYDVDRRSRDDLAGAREAAVDRLLRFLA